MNGFEKLFLIFFKLPMIASFIFFAIKSPLTKDVPLLILEVFKYNTPSSSSDEPPLLKNEL